MLIPTRTAAYWIVGLAAKLCQEFGLTEERSIPCSNDGEALNAFKIDMRRKLSWVTIDGAWLGAFSGSSK